MPIRHCKPRDGPKRFTCSNRGSAAIAWDVVHASDNALYTLTVHVPANRTTSREC